jgi:CRP-like cAMP-binding protein
VTEGSLVGEEPLVGAAAALASAWAEGDVDLIEIPYDAIAKIARAEVEEALGRLLRAHFLQTLLRTSPLFRSMEPAERVRLLERMEPVTLPGGATLVIERQPARGIWLVLSGQVAVRVTRSAPASHAVHRIETQEGSVVSVVGPGGIVGLASSLTTEPATATSSVTQPATGLFLSAEELRKLGDANAEVGRDLVEEAFARKERTGAARRALRRDSGETRATAG